MTIDDKTPLYFEDIDGRTKLYFEDILSDEVLLQDVFVNNPTKYIFRHTDCPIVFVTDGANLFAMDMDARGSDIIKELGYQHMLDCYNDSEEFLRDIAAIEDVLEKNLYISSWDKSTKIIINNPIDSGTDILKRIDLSAFAIGPEWDGKITYEMVDEAINQKYDAITKVNSEIENFEEDYTGDLEAEKESIQKEIKILTKLRDLIEEQNSPITIQNISENELMEPAPENEHRLFTDEEVKNAGSFNPFNIVGLNYVNENTITNFAIGTDDVLNFRTLDHAMVLTKSNSTKYTESDAQYVVAISKEFVLNKNSYAVGSMIVNLLGDIASYENIEIELHIIGENDIILNDIYQILNSTGILGVVGYLEYIKVNMHYNCLVEAQDTVMTYLVVNEETSENIKMYINNFRNSHTNLERK